MTRKFLFTFLAGIIILCSSSSMSGAAVISPSLQNVLNSLGPQGHIPIIINLADKVDSKQLLSTLYPPFASNAKAYGRTELLKALKEKAKLTQGRLKTLLKNIGATKVTPFWITNSIAVTVSVSVISELMSLPEVESIELDGVLQAPVIVPAAAAITEWNITRINAPALWAADITGTGIVVANFDTGVDVTHPDLGPKWRGGGCAAPPDCDSWFDPYTSSTLPYDNAGSLSTGHGTGTMGVMVGNSATAAYGVAPGAQWIAAKIFNDAGNSTASNIILAFQWVLAPGGNAANAPDVVNNSWGYDGSPNICEPQAGLQAAIQNVEAAGIAVVFSAGNTGPNPSTSVSPANYPGSFAVGAADSSNAIYILSSRGPSACDGGIFPNVVAPGVSIRTAAPSSVQPSLYQNVSGTSFSTPHVAGAEALLMSVFPTLTHAKVETALEQTAVNIGAPASVPNITYGYGLIDVSKALSYLTSHGEISIPEIAGYHSSFDYGTIEITSPLISQTFTVTNRSSVNSTVNSITLAGPNASEFSISNNTCNGNILAPLTSCTFMVRPISLGTNTAQVSISYDNSTYNVPISGNVVPPVARVQGTTVVATYPLLQTAYSNCSSGDIVGMLATTVYHESPNFNSPSNISVSLQGGYNPSFGLQYGFSTLQGTLTISSGKVAVGNLILQ